MSTRGLLLLNAEVQPSPTEQQARARLLANQASSARQSLRPPAGAQQRDRDGPHAGVKDACVPISTSLHIVTQARHATSQFQTVS